MATTDSINGRLVPVYTGEPTPGFTQSQISLIQRTIAKDCSNDELALFLEVCRTSGLDPFRKQIYAIKRGGQMTIQTGIDGYRLLAARTGDLAGIDDPNYDSEDADHPNWARVTVYRWSHNQRVPYTATARWKEYQQQGGNWGKMPYLMLGKCAEALALRRAFPAELSGIYTPDEISDEQRSMPYVEAAATVHVQETREDERITAALRNREILSLLTDLGYKEQGARRDKLVDVLADMDEKGISGPGSLKLWLSDELKYSTGPASLEELSVGERGN